MKKLMATLLVMAMVITTITAMFTTNVSAAAAKADVGKTNGTTVTGFEGTAKANQLKEAFVKEWERGQTVYTENGKKYFSYGDTTDEFVHAWVGESNMMNQDFVNGDSTCATAFDHQVNWSCIVCWDPKNIAGSTFTVRDAIAQVWSQSGGPNSDRGAPTSNQFWIVKGGKEYLYQTFQNGYYEALNGKYYNAEFFNKADDGYKAVTDSKVYNRPSHGKLTSSSSVKASSITSVKPSSVKPGTSTPSGATSRPDGASNTSGGTSNTSGGVSGGDASAESGDTAALDSIPDDASVDAQGNIIGEDGSIIGHTDDSSAAAAGTTGSTREMNVPATIGIIGGAVVLLGGGAFCLYWFVLRKKKLAVDGDESALDADDTTSEDSSEDDK